MFNFLATISLFLEGFEKEVNPKKKPETNKETSVNLLIFFIRRNLITFKNSELLHSSNIKI
jgi:hypothetical protein